MIYNSIPALDSIYSQTLCLYAPVHDAFSYLKPDEAATVQKAVDKRRNEYSTGRWLAHQALDTLQFPADSLLSGPNREPLWPKGVIGSIAHNDQHAVVMISSHPLLEGLGIDLEKKGRVDEPLVQKILTQREQASLDDIDPTLLFSAKEAVYKLLFPIVRKYVGFQDIEISIDLKGSAFTASYVGDNPACCCVDSARGSFVEIGDSWLTQVYLKR